MDPHSPSAEEPLRLLVHRHNLRDTCLAADTDALRALAPGQARLRIDRFALTANNITYAAFGEAMKYWDFFPTEATHLGCIPVWGFATVVESRAAGVEPGVRCWGYWPMGTHLVVTPAGTDERGFVDASPHRTVLPSAYNRVQFCRADPTYSVDNEARQALLRPLFMTSFLIDDFLAEHDFFGARQVLLSSASSKTAYGTALCLSARKPDGVIVTGLTARANLPFAASLGCYDEVLAYDDLRALDRDRPTVYVDLSGSTPQRLAVHMHFNGALSYSCFVGGTHWNELAPGAPMPGPRPTLFFAPTQLRKRLNPPPTGWGPDGLQQRIDAAWARLMQAMDGTAGEAPWLVVDYRHGATAVRGAYLELLEGRSNPRAGQLLSFHPSEA